MKGYGLKAGQETRREELPWFAGRDRSRRSSAVHQGERKRARREAQREIASELRERDEDRRS